MDYRLVDIDKIKYSYNNLYYDSERLVILTPELICHTGIEKYYDKYELKLILNMENEQDKRFYQFLKALEENNKLNSNHLAEYKSQIDKNFILTLKIPFRYEKFEIIVDSNNSTYLPTSVDIKKDCKVRCKIQMSKIWSFYKNNKLMSGCLMELKHILLV